MNVRRRQHPIATLVVMTVAVLVALSAPMSTLGLGKPGSAPLVADLEGQPLELARVGTLYCHDFDFPRIHCFRTAAALTTAVTPVLATSSVNYVLIFDYTTYAGAYMYISQDYSILAVIGWNDRISSFKAVNSQSGTFYGDWLYGGSQYGFCCNQNVSSLGSYNDTFSSVARI
jgi:hypothetical protein